MTDYKKLAKEISGLAEKAGAENVASLVKVTAKGYLAPESAGAVMEKMAALSEEEDRELFFPDYSELPGGDKSVLTLSPKEAEFAASGAFLVCNFTGYGMERLCAQAKSGADVNGFFRFLDRTIEKAGPELGLKGLDRLGYLAAHRNLIGIWSEGWLKPGHLLRPDWIDCQEPKRSLESIAAVTGEGTELSDLDAASRGRLGKYKINELAQAAGNPGDALRLASALGAHEDMSLWRAGQALSLLSESGHPDPFGLLERIGFFGKCQKIGGRCWDIFEEAFSSEDPEGFLAEENPAMLCDDDAWIEWDRLAATTGLGPHLNNCSGTDELLAMEDVWDLPDSEAKEANIAFLGGPELSKWDRISLARLAKERPDVRLDAICYPAGRFGCYDTDMAAEICADEPALGRLLQESEATDRLNLFGLLDLAKSGLSPEDKARVAKTLGLDGETVPGTDVPSGHIGKGLGKILLKYESPLESPVWRFLTEDYPGDWGAANRERVAAILGEWVFAEKPVFTQASLEVMADRGLFGANALPEGEDAGVFFAPGLTKAQVEEMLRLRRALGEDFRNGPDWAAFSGAALAAVRRGLGGKRPEPGLLSKIRPDMTAGEIKAALAA